MTGLTVDANAALISIDMQRGFDLLPGGHSNNPAVEINGARLLAAWRAHHMPLIHVRHDSIEPGSKLAPGLPGNAFRTGFEPRGNETLVTKTVNAAFIGTDLDLRLRRLGVGQVILFGLTTDMCVSTTARVAANIGYRTLVVGDACACFGAVDVDGRVIAAADMHRIHLATLGAEFAEVVTTDKLLASLAALAARSTGTMPSAG